MSALTTLTLAGKTIQANFEYTSGDVASQFQQAMQPFIDQYNIIQQGVANSNGAPIAPPTDQQIEAMKEGVANLINLGTFGGSTTDFLDVEMATQADLLIKTLQASGMVINYPPNFGVSGSGNTSTVTPLLPFQITFDANAAAAWQDLALESPIIQQVLSNSQVAGSYGNRTLQALVELVYVKTGNQTISDSLSSLQSALTGTTDAVNTLTSLQNLHNKITTVGPKDFLKTQLSGQLAATGSSAATDFINGYPGIASSFFGHTLNPVLSDDIIADFDKNGTQFDNVHFNPGPNYLATADQLIQLRDKLNLQISALSKTTPRIPDPSHPGQTMEDPSTLLGHIRTVYNDIVNHIGQETVTQLNDLNSATDQEAFYQKFKRWVLDDYDLGTGSTLLGNNAPSNNIGTIQQDLTNAITAAQALNSTQQDRVNRYLFVFQQYYQSASSMLTAINTLINKISDQISRS